MDVFVAVVITEEDEREARAFSSEPGLVAFLRKLANKRIEDDDIEVDEQEAADQINENDDAPEIAEWISENTPIEVEVYEATVDEE